MNNKRVEDLIPKAITYIQNKFVKNESVEKVYSGYLNSLGPSIITAGLLNSVSFYTGDDKKKKIMTMLFELLKNNYLIETDKESLLDYLSGTENYKNIDIKNKIIDATIACKLAIKTFDLKE